jgi:translation initiation factor IF-1
VNITITVPWTDRGKGTENWKEPFKKLKLSKIRAEDEWKILLHVHGKDAKKILKLAGDRLKIETVMEEDTKETWADKVRKKEKFSPSVAEGEGA